MINYTAEYKDKIFEKIMANEKIIKLLDIDNPDTNIFSTDDILIGGTFYIKDGKQVSKNVKGSDEAYIQGRLFDYNFVDDFTVDEGTFIICEVLPYGIQDNMFISYLLCVSVFCNKELVRINNYSSPTVSECRDIGLKGVNRIDMLINLLEDSLIGTNDIAGISKISYYKKKPMEMFLPSSKYYGKTLLLEIKGYSDGRSDECGRW